MKLVYSLPTKITQQKSIRHINWIRLFLHPTRIESLGEKLYAILFQLHKREYNNTLTKSSMCFKEKLEN